YRPVHGQGRSPWLGGHFNRPRPCKRPMVHETDHVDGSMTLGEFVELLQVIGPREGPVQLEPRMVQRLQSMLEESRSGDVTHLKGRNYHNGHSRVAKLLCARAVTNQSGKVLCPTSPT
ncbi:hypothetical protein BGZ94_006094, partial [Podila epigama]